VEVSTTNAQKLRLAESIGQLSLALRRPGVAAQHSTQPFTLDDLLQRRRAGQQDAAVGCSEVVITRGGQPTKYGVNCDERPVPRPLDDLMAFQGSEYENNQSLLRQSMEPEPVPERGLMGAWH